MKLNLRLILWQSSILQVFYFSNISCKSLTNHWKYLRQKDNSEFAVNHSFHVTESPPQPWLRMQASSRLSLGKSTAPTTCNAISAATGQDMTWHRQDTIRKNHNTPPFWEMSEEEKNLRAKILFQVAPSMCGWLGAVVSSGGGWPGYRCTHSLSPSIAFARVPA